MPIVCAQEQVAEEGAVRIEGLIEIGEDFDIQARRGAVDGCVHAFDFVILAADTISVAVTVAALLGTLDREGADRRAVGRTNRERQRRRKQARFRQRVQEDSPNRYSRFPGGRRVVTNPDRAPRTPPRQQRAIRYCSHASPILPAAPAHENTTLVIMADRSFSQARSSRCDGYGVLTGYYFSYCISDWQKPAES